MRLVATGCLLGTLLCAGPARTEEPQALACPPNPNALDPGCTISTEPAKPEHGPPIAERGQAVEGHPDRRAGDDEKPRPKAGWPPSIEAGEEASHTECGTPEECRSEQRDYSDLRAQWKAADAAEGQHHLAWWQTWIALTATAIAGLGTFYVVWSFKETRRSADAANAAADAAIVANRMARESYRTQVRAWMVYQGGEINFNAMKDGTINFVAVSLVWKNNGQTPAISVQGRISAGIPAGTEPILDLIGAAGNYAIGPQGKLRQLVNIGVEDFKG